MNLDRSCLPVAAAVLLFSAISQAQSTQRVTVDSTGAQANDECRVPVLSGDNRFVGFVSAASNLVQGDTNGVWDVFVRDRLNGATERVSVGPGGVQGDGDSGFYGHYLPIPPAFSADGRYVAFESNATNLVANDTNDGADVFVHDRQTGITECVSVSPGGTPGNSHSRLPAISPDGRWVVFQSFASDLVPGDTNMAADIFVRDRLNGTTECVSLNMLGAPSNLHNWGPCKISGDGRFVAFLSVASDLVPGDTNGYIDVFVRDRLNALTERVSVSTSGVQPNFDCGNCALSLDGRFVAFHSIASNLVAGDTNGAFDVFVHDRQSGSTERVSLDSSDVQGNLASFAPSISADGRFVAFESRASNLVSGDTNGSLDVFLRDRLLRTTERASVRTDGTQGNSDSVAAAVSADGHCVTFESVASDLVAGDTNAASDGFLRDSGAHSGTAFCAGDGSFAACPCGNSGAAGRGCENSAATGGAVLAATGNPAPSFDSLVLTCSGELPSAASIFLQGSASVAPINFGDGLRCTGGSLRRLYVHSAAGGVVFAPGLGEPTISARSATLGDPILSGTTRYYQTYYRDPSPAFCPIPQGNNWNVSSGLAVTWL